MMKKKAKKNKGKLSRKRKLLKKQKNRKKKLLLETSVLIKRLVGNPKIKQFLDKDSLEYDFYSSYYVFYEFKLGFLYSLIGYYLTVEAHDNVADAIEDWSNRFSTRDKSNFMLLLTYIHRTSTNITIQEKDVHLAEIEAVIFTFLKSFNKGLVLPLVGEFSDAEILQFEITSKEDFPEFLAKFEKYFIPLGTFWTTHHEKLKAILLAGESHKTRAGTYKKTGFGDVLKRLAIIDNDFAEADKKTISLKIGDAVIAVDTPESFKIATLDRSFEGLGPALQKDVQRYDIKIHPKKADS